MLSANRYVVAAAAVPIAVKPVGVVAVDVLVRNRDASVSLWVGGPDLDSSLTHGFEVKPGETLGLGLGYTLDRPETLYGFALSACIVDVIVRTSA